LSSKQFISNLTTGLIAAVLLSIALPLKLNTSFIFLIGALFIVQLIAVKKEIQVPIFFATTFLFASLHALHFWIHPFNTSLNFELEKKIPFLVIPLFFSVLELKNKLNSILKIVVHIAALYVIFLVITAVCRFILNGDSTVFFYHNLLDIIDGNAIYFSLFFTITLISSFELFLKFEDRFYLLNIALFVLIILLLSSKIFTLLLVLIFAYYTIAFVKSKRNRRILFLVFCIGLSFSMQKIITRFKEIDKISLLTTKQEITPATNFDGYSLRKELVGLGKEISADSSHTMLVGVGPGICQEILNQKLIDKHFYTGDHATSKVGFYNYNFHNQYLQTFIETGWLGFISLLFMLITPFYIVEKDNRRMVVLINGLFITGFITESFLSRQMGIVSYLSFNALFVAHFRISLNLFIKRIFDILFSSLVIVVILSWLLPVLGLFIILDLRASPLFVQWRVGKNGELFRCFKLRTMKKNELQHKIAAQIDDDRITGYGAFLRKYALDELPQFFNVFLGSMSVVGPRPLMVSDEEKFNELIPNFSSRLSMKPGITGFAQAFGYKGYVGSRLDIANRYRLDKKYSQIQSLWLDVKLILLTIKAVVYSK
jgi:lipopolysaccharide/colanic/teichoic acid biosynthesis glycosyltransferase